MPKARFENLEETAAFAVFSVEHTAVLIWKEPPVPEGVDACKRLFALLRARRPKERFGYFTIVESRAGSNMPAPVRDALSAMLRDFQHSIAGAAIVFEGTGFRAAIVRSVVAAINLASRLDFTASVEANVQAGATFLADKQRATQLSAQQLVDSLREFRARPGYQASTG